MFNINPSFGTFGYKQGVHQVSDPVVIYGLRKLIPSYNGYCIKVRRASDSVEQDIGFDGNDLDTTSLLSFIGSSHGTIRTWYDQSGNGFNAHQTTNARQPYIVLSGSLITINTKPAIKFGESVYSNLVTDSYISVLGLTDKEESYGVLMEFSDSGSTTNILYENNGNGSLDNPGMEQKATGRMFRYDDAGALQGLNSGAYTLSPSLRFQTISENDLKMRVYRGDSEIDSVTVTGFQDKTIAQICIGGRYYGGYLYNTTYYTGKVSEFYIFAKKLTDNEIKVIKNNSYEYHSI